MNKDVLLEMLPDYFARLKQMKEIARVEGKKFDKLDSDVDSLLDQFFIRTATWSLGEWEKRYRLPVLDDVEDYEYRRKRVLTAKRSNKAKLIDILRLVEPTIELAWGRLVLPFTIESDLDYYDFGELVRILEKEKPSHLGYSFTIKPNGYTVRSNLIGRNQVALQLISGTTKSGRYPRHNAHGHTITRNTSIKSTRLTGSAKYQRAAGLVSNGKDVQTSFGVVERESINIKSHIQIGSAEYVPSGQRKSGDIAHKSNGIIEKETLDVKTKVISGNSVPKKSGEINTKSISSLEKKRLEMKSFISTGTSTTFTCGSRVSGQKVVI